jgi:hypothetical protein
VRPPLFTLAAHLRAAHLPLTSDVIGIRAARNAGNTTLEIRSARSVPISRDECVHRAYRQATSERQRPDGLGHIVDQVTHADFGRLSLLAPFLFLVQSVV